ncbi:MAG: hypothetical protein UEP57_02425 [Oscillospiraceae bacterium]|nr:hypothetical protein [Oscillospiraceae bacterium]
MTAEQLHDALTLLPADLVAQADKKRSRRPRGILWKRYAAMAACLAVILCGSWLFTRLFAPKSTAEKASETAMMYAAQDADEACFDAAAEEAAAAAIEETLCAPPTAAASENSASTGSQTGTVTGNGAAIALDAGISQPVYVEAIPIADSSACFGSPAPQLFCSRAELEAYFGNPISPFDLTNLMEVCEGCDDIWFENHDLLLVTLCSVPASGPSAITAIYEEDGQWYICVESDPDSTEVQRNDWFVLIETEKGLIDSADAVTLLYE